MTRKLILVAGLTVLTVSATAAEGRYELGEPVNLGPVVNTAAGDGSPSISVDGLELYFSDYMVYREGGLGKSDLWVARRESKDAPWQEPVNLGSVVNTDSEEITPEVSSNGLEHCATITGDGLTLFFDRTPLRLRRESRT